MQLPDSPVRPGFSLRREVRMSRKKLSMLVAAVVVVAISAIHGGPVPWGP
jgi:hypothetical protein